MLAPLAVVGSNPEGAGEAVITYLLIYAAMNLGCLRGGAGGRPQDPQRRDPHLGRAVRVRARPHAC